LKLEIEEVLLAKNFIEYCLDRLLHTERYLLTNLII